jgi:putative transcriptional regulator
LPILKRNMSRDYKKMSAFEQIKAGLEDALANVRGELPLKSITLPAPPPPASRATVISLRKKLKMSQSVFAATLNVSTERVQSWEQGELKPERGELRLIEILAREPELVTKLILINGSTERPVKKPLTGGALSRQKAASAR